MDQNRKWEWKKTVSLQKSGFKKAFKKQWKQLMQSHDKKAVK